MGPGITFVGPMVCWMIAAWAAWQLIHAGDTDGDYCDHCEGPCMDAMMGDGDE